jgi:hypothetical protein
MSGGANVLLGSAPAGPASQDYPSTSTSLSYAPSGSGGAVPTTSSGSRVPDDVLQLLRSDAEAAAYSVVNPRFVGAVPFRNLAPQSRMERRAKSNKDSLEKQRLRDRTGGFYRADPLGQKIVGFEQGAPGYQSEALRFDTDVGGEQRRMRAAALELEHRKIANIRSATMARNEMRRQQMIAASDAEMARQLALQRHPTKSLNNQQSVPYDAITLVYDTSGAGQALLESDQAVRVRAQNRAVLLASKMTADGYNPITGEKLVLPDLFQVPTTSH